MPKLPAGSLAGSLPSLGVEIRCNAWGLSEYQAAATTPTMAVAAIRMTMLRRKRIARLGCARRTSVSGFSFVWADVFGP
ncbi:hypothetical protein GCM10011329_11440 [Stakelama pacifica]|nr:hypothetical protein GCM10011329_11440 [Stakelama pacifica]